mgnify:CR=1 FL=1
MKFIKAESKWPWSLTYIVSLVFHVCHVSLIDALITLLLFRVFLSD